MSFEYGISKALVYSSAGFRFIPGLTSGTATVLGQVSISIAGIRRPHIISFIGETLLQSTLSKWLPEQV